MRWLTRGFLALLLILAVIRAVEFLGCAFFEVQSPLDAYNLEAKMVHLAWRVQHRVRLYPEWRDYPHVANFFAPCYFALVGLIGRSCGASIEGLYAIGRGVTLASALATALLIAALLGRRDGRGAAVLGAALSLGLLPMHGFGFMARPDLLADLLGFAGFVLVVGRRAAWAWAGGALLVLAVLTKQTAGAYLLAAALGLWVEGRRRRSIALLIGTAAVLAEVVAVVQVGFEPHFLEGLLAEGRTPWSLATWAQVLDRLARGASELPLLALAGLVLWNTGGRRERSWSALAVVLLLVSFATSAKRGADLNYFLGLRLVAALAAGTLWAAAWRRDDPAPGGRTLFAVPLAVTLAVGGVAWLLLPQRPYRSQLLNLGSGLVAVLAAGTLWDVAREPGKRAQVGRLVLAGLLVDVLALSALAWLDPLGRAFEWHKYLLTGQGRQEIRVYEGLFRTAADPARRILTDSGEIDIRQGERTVFADPWLFRMLVETGRIRPAQLEAMIERQDFERIVTTRELFAADYATYDFGLPLPLAERARARYGFAGAAGGLFFYEPRRTE